ncbi:F-box/LRR-repeat protein 4 [Anopheles moucheti]|uniref:F-box/LRR-repeat protein 4 n=1 Tax=Anopheles moucheti TaxID=186751 RepID=UPI0022F0255D|nr:F-box/LRR-repeat protein 4 [Anopheles moucheti]
MQQYADRIIYTSCEYGPERTISYNSINVIGGPSNFPLSNTDQLDSYLLSSYGNWNVMAPSFAPEFGVDKIPTEDNPPIDAFIVVSFEKSVYPTGVEVYETMNPGAVYRIWAYTEFRQWMLLWDKRVDAVHDDIRNADLKESRIFVPAIRIINQRTCVLRVEFSTCELNYIYAMDAIMLKSAMSNMDEPIPFAYMSEVKGWREDGEITHQPTPCSLIEEVVKALDASTSKLSLNDKQQMQPVDNRRLPQQVPKEPLQQGPSITNLPYEMVYKILTYLDLKSLRNMEQVSAAFRNVARDRRLYREVNLRPYWMDVDSKLLTWLKDRCVDIRKLDLSWCGLFQTFTKPQLERFLSKHGPSLTHLRLNSIGFHNSTIFGISNYTNLTELCLQNADVSDVLNLKMELTKLTRLDLSGAIITGLSLNNLLCRNQGLQHLNLSCCIFNSVQLTQTIGRFNRQLISLNLFKTRICHEQDLIPLTNCTKLQELNLGYANDEYVEESELGRVIEACPELRKLVLAGFRDVHNNNIFAIAQHCLELEYLDLLGCITVTGESVNALFIGCSSLRFLEINHCWNIMDHWITEWKERYPNVAIKYGTY